MPIYVDIPSAVGLLQPARGTDLTDADATIQPFTLQKSLFVLQNGILSTNRALTFGITSLSNGQVTFILCLDTSANTYTIKNNAAGTLYTHQGSVTGPMWYEIFSSAGDWIASTKQFAQPPF